MKIAVSGSSGLIGAALVSWLRSRGHHVWSLVRREPRDERELRWDPARAELDADAFSQIEGVVHLAGAGMSARRWTRSRRRARTRAQSSTARRPLGSCQTFGDHGPPLVRECADRALLRRLVADSSPKGKS